MKSAPSGTIDDTRNEGDGPHTMCTDGKVTKFGDDCNKPVDDGVAHWQAPKPPVPEDIKDVTICDNLPETQKITCLMNLIAPEKAAQDGYDCTMDRTPKTITISCTLKEPK